jgi:hypothetical protein
VAGEEEEHEGRGLRLDAVSRRLSEQTTGERGKDGGSVVRRQCRPAAERRTHSPMRQLFLQRRLEASPHRLLVRPAEQIHLERIERRERINQGPFVGTKALLSQSVIPFIPWHVP